MITYIIIGITVVVSFLCFSNRKLFEDFAFTPYLIIRKQQWYRFLTHGFVHGDTTHLLVNMFTFWSFGTYMEDIFVYLGFGTWGFLLLYFGGMIVASIHDLITQKDNPHYSFIGASGAVSAILFSSILFEPWEMIMLFAVIPIPGILFGVLYLFYCQHMAKKGEDNINHNAHFYGAVYGFLLPILFDPSLVGFFFEQLF